MISQRIPGKKKNNNKDLDSENSLKIPTKSENKTPKYVYAELRACHKMSMLSNLIFAEII